MDQGGICVGSVQSVGLGGLCICRNPTTRSSANVHSPKFMCKALDKNGTSFDYKMVRKGGSKDKKINFFFVDSGNYNH